MEIHRRKPPPSETTLKTRFLPIYKNQFEKRLNDLEDDDEIFWAAETLLELKELLSWVRERLDNDFKQELKVKKRRDVPNWREAPTIEAALGKTRFEDVWGYIWQHTIPLGETVTICERKNICDHIRMVKGKERKSRYVLFQPNYQEMSEALKLSKQSLWKYVKRMVEMGILKQLVPHGRTWAGIYAAGLFSIQGQENRGHKRQSDSIPLRQ